MAEAARMNHGGHEGENRILTKEGDVHMFMGEYSHTIDAKGRMIIPSKFREELGEEFVLTKMCIRDRSGPGCGNRSG